MKENLQRFVEKKSCQSRILMSVKIPFKNEGKVKLFRPINRELITCRYALENCGSSSEKGNMVTGRKFQSIQMKSTRNHRYLTKFKTSFFHL